MRLLEELGAFETSPDTEDDRAAAAHPVGRHWRGCRSTRGSAGWCSRPTGWAAPREVLVIVAALSIQDPRERPLERQARADAEHARFADKRSDFARLPQPVALPQGAAERAVRQRLPADVQGGVPALPADPRVAGPHRQLRQAASGRGSTPTGRSPGAEPDLDTVHQRAPRRAALARRVPRRGRSGEYLGARGARFGIWPGFRRCSASSPSTSWPAELVETTRLWARVNARIEPEWAEEAGAHLVKRSYSRAALVGEAGACRRHRAGHPLRRADRRRPDRRVREGRPRGVPAAVPPAGPGRGRLDDAATGSRTPTPALVERLARAGGAHPAARHHRRRRGAV